MQHIPLGQSAPGAPPIRPFAAGHTLLTFNVGEVQLVLGVGIPMVGEPNGNAYPIGYRIEWQSSLMMSPQTAKHTMMQLQDAIASYEALFGEIKQDPAASPAMSDDGRVVSLGLEASLRAQGQSPRDGDPEFPGRAS